MMTWKNKSKIKKLQQLIKDFNLFIKQCYLCYLWKPKSCKDKKKGRIMLSSRCATYNSKKLRFIKEQTAGQLLTGLDKIPIFGAFFF